MGERLQAIAAEGFRGLPKTSIGLKSRNLCVLGGNGKGKSALVDAVEFALSGTIARFTGAGTGNIDLNEALRNVRLAVTPRVTLSFQPSNKSVARSLGQGGRLASLSPVLQTHLDQHPLPSRFILRRAALLDFIHAQDANRHQMFMKLMGLVRLDQVQWTLREACDGAKSAWTEALAARSRQLEALRPAGGAKAPTSLADVMREIDGMLTKLAVAPLSDWAHLDDRIARVAALRRAENSARIDRLNTAIATLGGLVPENLTALATKANALTEKLRELEADDSDASRVPTIESAATYMTAHVDETVCPICEREFDAGHDEVLERLRARLLAQAEVAECRRALDETYAHLRDGVRLTADQLSRDAIAMTSLGGDGVKPLAEARDLVEALATRLPPVRKDCKLVSMTVPPAIPAIATTRRSTLADLKRERDGLVAKETATVEDCYRLLTLGRERLAKLTDAESGVVQTKQTFDRLAATQDAVGLARDKAVQKVMDRIADRVLDFYKHIHAISAMDKPECESVSFRLTGRAERGSTQLVVKFLGKEAGDPKAFLSEGHLDSLGLCIFLACVRLFNPEGTLLVLDDVLTSVDKEHRHRVGDLIYAEFAEYQAIVTTHDEYWFEQLQAAAKACGADERWRFVRITSWSPEVGPEFGDVSANENFIRDNLQDPQYRGLGGALRAVFEDFVRKCGARLEIKVRFRLDGRYSGGDLVTLGFGKTLRDALVKKSPSDVGAIDRELRHSVGAPLVNALAHGDERRLEATLTEVSDFFDGVRALRTRARDAGLYP